MLNYNLLTFSKMGFFLGSTMKSEISKSMVSFLYCSRNNFFVIDFLDFFFYSRKLLFFFQNVFFKKLNILFLLENNTLLSQRIENKINTFYTSLSLSKLNFSNHNNFLVQYNFLLFNNSFFFVNTFFLKNNFYSNFKKLFLYYSKRRSGRNNFFDKIQIKKLNFLFISKYFCYNNQIKNSVINQKLFFKKNLNSIKFDDIKYVFVYNIFVFKYLLKNNSKFFFKLNNLLDCFILYRNYKMQIVRKLLIKFFINYNKLYFFFNLLNTQFYENQNMFNFKKFSYSFYLNRLNNFFTKNRVNISNKNHILLKKKNKKEVVLKKILIKTIKIQYKLLFSVFKKRTLVKKWITFFFFKRNKKSYFSFVFSKYKNLISLFFFLDNYYKKLRKSLSFSFLQKKDKFINNVDIKLFNTFVGNLDKRFSSQFLSFSKRIIFWYSKWLNGGFTNYYGLKTSLKKDNIDFFKLKNRGIPDIVFFFYMNNYESFLNEIISLNIPLFGISNLHMDSSFFNYFIPSNNLNQDFMFFYFLLILESFLRSYIKEQRMFILN